MYRIALILVAILAVLVVPACGDPQERSHGDPALRKRAKQEEADSSLLRVSEETTAAEDFRHDLAQREGDKRGGEPRRPNLEKQLEEFLKPENFEVLIKPIPIQGAPPAGVLPLTWDRLGRLMRAYAREMEPTKAAQAVRKIRAFLETLPKPEGQVLEKLLGLR
jgi:hypothetical protein